MKDRKFYGIYNPKARGGRTKKYSERIISVLDDHGIDNMIESSSSIEDARSKVEQALSEGYNTLIAIGGDGTVHHIANMAIESDTLFAVIPAGSGNDFAASLTMTNDIDRSIDTLLDGKEMKLSTVRTTTSDGSFWTINIADVGLGAKVAYSAQRKLKWMAGQIKYDLISVWEIFAHKAFNARINFDGNEEEIPMHMLIAGMGQTAASGMNFLPDVRFNHNTMQGGIIQTNCNKFQMARALQKVRRAQHKDLPYIRMFRAKKIEVEVLGEEIMVESEGEMRGTTALTMEVVPERFRVIVPKEFQFEDENIIAVKQKYKT